MRTSYTAHEQDLWNGRDSTNLARYAFHHSLWLRQTPLWIALTASHTATCQGTSSPPMLA